MLIKHWRLHKAEKKRLCLRKSEKIKTKVTRLDQESAMRLDSFCCSNSTVFPSLFVPLSALNTRPMERQVGKPMLLVLVCVNSLGAKTELSCFGPEVDWLWDCAGLVGLPQTWQCGSCDQLLWTCLYQRLPQWLEPFHRRFSQQGCKGQFTGFKTGDIVPTFKRDHGLYSGHIFVLPFSCTIQNCTNSSVHLQ